MRENDPVYCIMKEVTINMHNLAVFEVSGGPNRDSDFDSGTKTYAANIWQLGSI